MSARTLRTSAKQPEKPRWTGSGRRHAGISQEKENLRCVPGVPGAVAWRTEVLQAEFRVRKACRKKERPPVPFGYISEGDRRTCFFGRPAQKPERLALLPDGEAAAPEGSAGLAYGPDCRRWQSKIDQRGTVARVSPASCPAGCPCRLSLAALGANKLRFCTRGVHPLVQRVSRCRPPVLWGTGKDETLLTEYVYFERSLNR